MPLSSSLPLTPFVHLRVHSAYSLSEGAIKIPNLLEFCCTTGMPAVAITDHANIFGAMEFSLAALKKGIQPLIGVTIPLLTECDKADKNYELQQSPSINCHDLVLLAQTEEGYHNLIKILSRAYMRDAVLVPVVSDVINDRDHGMPTTEHRTVFATTLKDLEGLSKGLVCLSGGEEGILNSLILKDKVDAAKQKALVLKKLFPERFYIEIHRRGERIDGKTYTKHSSAELVTEPVLLDFAKSLDLPIVATNSAYFLDKDDYFAHDALRCIADGKRLHDQKRRRSREGFRMLSGQEMSKLFEDLPEAIENTCYIARSCCFVLEPKKPALPPFETKIGEADELRLQAEQGLKQRLTTQVFSSSMHQSEKDVIAQTYHQRLHYEIGVINKMGYAGYFLIVADFIKYAKSQRIPVGPGRGSGAGSLVAWSLTITDVDPIRFNLIFERFLNPERVSMPDFDIDFCQEKRDRVIAYVCHKYGPDRVAQIVTFGKFQARMIIRDLCRIYGVPFQVSSDVAKLIPNDPTNPLTLQQAFDQDKSILLEMKRLLSDYDDSLIENALRLEGLYRHASTHAAGIVIGGEPLENIVALYRDADARTVMGETDQDQNFRLKDLPATQFNMKYVELTSLVKFDFLGLKTLSIMQRCVDTVLKTRGIDVDLTKIPLDDKKTFDLLCRLETVGVFQLESAGMREVVRDLQPSQFEEIIALVALYRPGPMDDIPRYIACRNGQEAVHYAHPLMEEILKETYGVMVYQEQVMQIAQKLAGYGLGAADLLRRAMGKKIKAEMDAQRDIFINGCAKHSNISAPLAHQIFDQMAKFASYGFNKCHSAPYGLIAYQTAYLKANYPHEFMAAMMTYDMNSTDKLAVIREELQRMNIPLHSADINASDTRFTVEDHATKGHAIRYALAAIKNVGEVNMDALVAERKKYGPFTSLENFLERMDSTQISKRTLENFIMCGVFDSLDPDRAKLLLSLASMMRYLGERKRQQQNGQSLLFGAEQGSMLPAVRYEKAQPWSKFERAQREFDALGLYLQEHPIEAYRSLLSSQKICSYIDAKTGLREGDDCTVNMAAVIVSKKERVSKSGKKFAFVQFSDPSGLFEAALFNETYAKSRHLLDVGQTVFMRALLRKDGDDVKVSLLSLSALEESTKDGVHSLYLRTQDLEAVELLYHALLQVPSGQGRIYLSLILEDQVVKLRLPKTYQLGRQTIETLSVIRNLDLIKG